MPLDQILGRDVPDLARVEPGAEAQCEERLHSAPLQGRALLACDLQEPDHLGRGVGDDPLVGAQPLLRRFPRRLRFSVGDLWNLYAQYPYLDRLRDRSVLEGALLGALNSIVWQLEAFALAEGYDEVAGRYVGLVLPGDRPEPMSLSDSWLVVMPGIATQQRGAESRSEPIFPSTPSGTSDPVLTPSPGHAGTPVPPLPAVRVVTRYFGSTRLDPERYGRDFARIQQEVLQHLEAAPGTRLEVSIEIQAVNGDGFSAETVRTVRENGTTLRFNANGFEET
ncbi:hypothetical protein [Cellulomonas xiejunii]|uniref:Baseplate protein J-like domain-containing protein n=1 Tax=Cellulomonas xiejunii TaxID=2968083 RepID=A0ABY5KQB0_9CELL|nr:hypothetical protein [Cellulomonas xiejunii]MCC2321349.1 hypothetical protein [Cellulomonas xiejunii]UUI71934.1 hypothetical protein NP048_00195 [Cellulomonas xiejunii]